MAIQTETYKSIREELDKRNITLVAVSKTKPVEDIQALYDLGQRDFGENYVQELINKASQLPKDIRWHFIGHLQTNKVKLIIPIVHLIQGVDSKKLLEEINKQGEKQGRVIDCLLQVHIAQEETKFGLNEEELNELMSQLANEPKEHAHVVGLMGMASLTNDTEKVRTEFRKLKSLFDQLPTPASRLPSPASRFTTLSMGMSSDYKIAIEEGSNMIRIGSLLFGKR